MGWYGPTGDCGCCNQSSSSSDPDPCVCRDGGGLIVTVDVNFTNDKGWFLSGASSTRGSYVTSCTGANTPRWFAFEAEGLMAMNGTYITTIPLKDPCVPGSTYMYQGKDIGWNTSGITYDLYGSITANSTVCTPACANDGCCFDENSGNRYGRVRVVQNNNIEVTIYKMFGTSGLRPAIISGSYSVSTACPLTLPIEATIDLRNTMGPNLNPAHKCHADYDYSIGSANVLIEAY